MLTKLWKDGVEDTHFVLVSPGSKADQRWRDMGYREAGSTLPKSAAKTSATAPAPVHAPEPAPAADFDPVPAASDESDADLPSGDDQPAPSAPPAPAQQPKVSKPRGRSPKNR